MESYTENIKIKYTYITLRFPRLAILRAFTSIYEDVRMKNVWCNIMEKIGLMSRSCFPEIFKILLHFKRNCLYFVIFTDYYITD